MFYLYIYVNKESLRYIRTYMLPNSHKYTFVHRCKLLLLEFVITSDIYNSFMGHCITQLSCQSHYGGHFNICIPVWTRFLSLILLTMVNTNSFYIAMYVATNISLPFHTHT